MTTPPPARSHNPGFPRRGKLFSIAWKIRQKVFHTVEKSAHFFPYRGKSAKKFSIPWKTPLFVLAALAAAGALNLRLLDLRARAHLTQAPPTENMPPSVALTTVALGGFRGILADVLWMRAGAIQEEGRYFELVQLSDWIVKLQPRSPPIWAYHAWNMAYNLSVLMPTPEEKWRWVRNGLVLLRDEGLRLNPGSARLHQELAWLFFHKLGTDDDSSAAYYRDRWAAEVDAGLAPLDPPLVRAIETRLAPLDWRTPHAHAIYWATAGLPYARTPFDDLALRRIVYQSLMRRIALGDRHLLAPAIDYVRETQRLHPRVAPLQEVLNHLLSAQTPFAPARP